MMRSTGELVRITAPAATAEFASASDSAPSPPRAAPASRSRCMRGHPVEKREYRARRAGPKVRAQHGIKPQRALQQRRLEMFLQQVLHTHAADAQQLAHVAAPEAPHAPDQVAASASRSDQASVPSRGGAAPRPARAPAERAQTRDVCGVLRTIFRRYAGHERRSHRGRSPPARRRPRRARWSAGRPLRASTHGTQGASSLISACGIRCSRWAQPKRESRAQIRASPPRPRPAPPPRAPAPSARSAPDSSRRPARCDPHR